MSVNMFSKYTNFEHNSDIKQEMEKYMKPKEKEEK